MNNAESRATLAWDMIVLACGVQLEEPQRGAMLKLVRAFGEARFEAGRAKESDIHAQREVDLLTQEYARRRGVAT